MTATAFLVLAPCLMVVGFWCFMVACAIRLGRERNKQDATALRRARLARMSR